MVGLLILVGRITYSSRIINDGLVTRKVGSEPTSQPNPTCRSWFLVMVCVSPTNAMSMSVKHVFCLLLYFLVYNL